MKEYLMEVNEIYKNAEIIEVSEKTENISKRYEGKQVSKKQTKLPTRKIFAADENQAEYKKFIEVRDDLQRITENYIKKIITNNKLFVDYKCGVCFNISQQPWIAIYTSENQKVAHPTSIYIGIQLELPVFGKDYGYNVWTGIGITGVKKQDRIDNRLSQINNMKKVTGSELDKGFEYDKSELDSGYVITKTGHTLENFEEDIKYLASIYLKYEESKEIGKASNKNYLARSLDIYYPDINNDNYYFLAFKNDYKLFLEDLAVVIKNANNNENNDYYLVLNEIDNYPSDYIQELKVLLERDKTNKSKYGLNNCYLSKLIYEEENKKIYFPSNLYVIATKEKNEESMLDNYFITKE